jgi:hypothetical protein
LAEQDGRIESSETVLLNPHGGDLSGFTLARGSEAQIAAVRAEPRVLGSLFHRFDSLVVPFIHLWATLGTMH